MKSKKSKINLSNGSKTPKNIEINVKFLNSKENSDLHYGIESSKMRRNSMPTDEDKENISSIVDHDYLTTSNLQNLETNDVTRS